MQFFADDLRARSGGAFEITIFPDGVIGQEVNLLSQAQAGKLDFVKASASVVERIGPSYRVFNLPFVFRDRTHWRAVATNNVGEGILASTETKGLVGLTYYEAGSRSFYARKAIDHPDDLKGLKIRIQPSPTMQRLMALFGAEGVALDWANVYNALQTRLVDGAENSIGALIVGRHAEVVTHYSFDEHTMVPDVFLVSAARWASFTSAQQRMVREAARASYHRMNDLWEAFEKDVRVKCEAIGVTFTYPDKAPFIDRAASLKDEFADDAESKRLIEQIARL
jgi:tripartite ATP-independent transporter DctP family solute receptor